MQYIPCSRHVLINKCCNESNLVESDQFQFNSFAEILCAYIHFKAQKNLELMKEAYAYFNPNQETPVFPKLNLKEKKQRSEFLASTFQEILINANYKKLSKQHIEEALTESSLVPVTTRVDLQDYDQIKLFFRGSGRRKVKIKRFFRSKEVEFENYDRVAVLLQTKDNEYFEAKEKRKEVLNFEPGKVYLYLYKNIPHYDLELLFPNVKISMNMRDKLMLVIPALGAAIPMLIKVLPSIGLLIGAIALVAFGWEMGGKFSVDISNPKAVYPLLVAVLSACVALGGFAARQYIKYKSKRLEFLKKVTDVLFFKSMDICQGVLNAIVDAAEEEESKEMLLVYFIFSQENQAMSKDEINAKANIWLEDHFAIKAELNVDRALEQLLLLEIPGRGDMSAKSIIEKLDNGTYRACDIESAKQIVDYVWDNVFTYSNQFN